MLEEGWVKISRKMLSWRWFSTPETAHLFLYMIIAASIETSDWKDITVPRGSFVSSIRKLSAETGLTEKQVRVALEHLKKTGEVAQSAYPKYSLFTVINYNRYQEKGHSEGTVAAQSGQARGKQGANRGQTKGNSIRIKEDKEDKEGKEYGDARAHTREIFCQQVGDTLSAYTGRLINSSDARMIFDLFDRCDNADIITDCIKSTAATFRPKYQGDRISSLKYFMPAINAAIASQDQTKGEENEYYKLETFI